MKDSKEKVDGALSYPAESQATTVKVQDFGPILSGLLRDPGRAAFKLEVESGQLVGINRIEVAAPENGYRDMRDAAKYLRHGYHWLSRHWKHLGLNPKKVGKVYFFAQEELDAWIRQQRGPRVGKKAKVVRVVSH